MPKIIENLESHLMNEAKKQIEQNGYGAVTIRSIAKACGVGVGTVYNYFPSKEALIATHLLGDWNVCIDAITRTAESAADPQPVLLCIYEQLVGFADRHQAIFRHEAAAVSFAGSFSRYHNLLRSQLAQPLNKFCGSDFAALLIAESLLTWSMAGKSFNEIYEILKKLF
ncbi:MAG: TetR/AcrR family transcriptional regulator [Oscillospiraceae bacterium]|nr:TetR/AcrR family transcriptional regulator [Oscillospiraceae bacterium]